MAKIVVETPKYTLNDYCVIAKQENNKKDIRVGRFTLDAWARCFPGSTKHGWKDVTKSEHIVSFLQQITTMRAVLDNLQIMDNATYSSDEWIDKKNIGSFEKLEQEYIKVSEKWDEESENRELSNSDDFKFYDENEEFEDESLDEESFEKFLNKLLEEDEDSYQEGLEESKCDDKYTVVVIDEEYFEWLTNNNKTDSRESRKEYMLQISVADADRLIAKHSWDEEYHYAGLPFYVLEDSKTKKRRNTYFLDTKTKEGIMSYLELGFGKDNVFLPGYVMRHKQFDTYGLKMINVAKQKMEHDVSTTMNELMVQRFSGNEPIRDLVIPFVYKTKYPSSVYSDYFITYGYLSHRMNEYDEMKLPGFEDNKTKPDYGVLANLIEEKFGACALPTNNICFSEEDLEYDYEDFLYEMTHECGYELDDELEDWMEESEE